MKSKLLKKVCQHDLLEGAWRVIQENARTSKSKEVRHEVEEFGQEAWARIRSLSSRLSRDKFEFKPAKGILAFKKDAKGIKTGKFRPIVLAPLETRIVQRALLEILTGFPQLEADIRSEFSFGGVRKKLSIDSGAPDRKSLSGVPAAINAVLTAIENGAAYYVCADIQGFFKCISKQVVIQKISKVVDDAEFIAFLQEAVATELDNMADLRSYAEDFPIEDIGVAQGSSLSPLLGNIIMAKFDLEMNKGGSCCIRYVDDFIILERTQKAANAQRRKAERLLKELAMVLSPEKSSKIATPIEKGISFLGISVVPGLIRPTSKKQHGFVEAVRQEYDKSHKAYLQVLHGKSLQSRYSLISTLKRVEGMVDAWGKAYFFCNDIEFFRKTDDQVRDLTRSFLGKYRDIRTKLSDQKRDRLLGIPRLSEQSRRPFNYPVTTKAIGANADR